MREDGQRRGCILGSIPPYGNLLLYDDFESLDKWEPVDLLPPGVWALDNSRAYNGNFGGYLKTLQATPDGYARAYRGREFGRIAQGHLEFSSLLSRWPLFGCQEIRLYVEIWTGTEIWKAGIGYEYLVKRWKYINEFGSWTLFVGPELEKSIRVWHQFKVGMDFAKRTYGVVVGGGIILTCSGERFYTHGSFGKVRSRVVLSIGVTGRRYSGAMFDDVLVRAV